jgi:hypothetical protein
MPERAARPQIPTIAPRRVAIGCVEEHPHD